MRPTKSTNNHANPLGKNLPSKDFTNSSVLITYNRKNKGTDRLPIDAEYINTAATETT